MNRFAVAAAAVCMLPAVAFAQEEMKVTMNDAPPAALAAAKAVAESYGVKLTEAGLDYDDAQATYEFAGKMDSGKMLEIDVLADGKIVEVEHEIGMDEVPEAVKQALSKHMPDFSPKMIEKSVHGTFEVYYEFEGEMDGGEIDVEISASGKRVIIQDDSVA